MFLIQSRFLSYLFPFNVHQFKEAMKIIKIRAREIIFLVRVTLSFHPQGRNVNDITEGFHPLKPLVWVIIKLFGYVRVLVNGLYCFPEDEKSGEQKAREEHLLRELFELIDERDKLERKKMTNMKK